MAALVLSDQDDKSELRLHLEELISNCLSERGLQTSRIRVGRNDLGFCMGCFGCWVRKPGECVIGDAMGEINRQCMNSDVVVYLSPVVFGQFSANLKNVIDRWLPNMLPFFETNPDGSTIHPSRYASNPCQFMIGYGQNVTEEDAQLFCDITQKHRNKTEALVYRGDDTQIIGALSRMKLERVSGQL
ncbi:MAG TPA: flavodoxin family protein [Clostridia bacterium]|nr:flavodoxin family protein [Clostridia bacterium]